MSAKELAGVADVRPIGRVSVPLVEGLEVRARFVVRYHGTPLLPYNVTLEALALPEPFRYICIDMRCELKTLDQPLTTVGLRAVNVTRLMSAAGQAILTKPDDYGIIRTTRDRGRDAAAPWFPAIEALRYDPRAIGRGGPTLEAIRATALTYRIAYLLGVPPTESVRETLGLEKGTAARWVSRAREAGLLAATTRGKAGV